MKTKETLIRLAAIADDPAPSGDDRSFVQATATKNLFARFFFMRVKNEAWLEQAVIEIEGKSLDDEGVWYRLLYLLRVSSPESLMRSLCRVRSRLTSRMLYDVVKALLGQTPDVAWTMRELVVDYIRQPAHIIASDLGAYLLHVAKAPAVDVNELLRIFQLVTEFRADPREAEKIDSRKRDDERERKLDPIPRLERWDYQQILEKAVPPLAKQYPLGVAQTLLVVVRQFLVLKFPTSQIEDGVRWDASTIWCQQLKASPGGHVDPEEALVHAFTVACETVYAGGNMDRASMQTLDAALRPDRWTLLERVRYHCYGEYPTITAEWIRFELTEYRKYRDGGYDHEFATMIRRAAEALREELLTEEERARIFDQIVAGPPDEELREHFGEHATPERVANRRRHLLLKNLWPFEPVLFGPYLDQFRTASAVSEPVTPDDYRTFNSGPARMIEYKSPIGTDALGAMTDEELVKYLNEWSNAARRDKEWWIEINYEGLATAFGQLLKSNRSRFEAFGPKWEQLRRPIYVRTAIEAARDQLKQGQPVQPASWVTLCTWVVEHETRAVVDEKLHEASEMSPDWEPARRAVTDFVGTCVEESAKVPLAWRGAFAELLGKLSTGHDRWLERGEPLVRPSDPLTDAINTTRGRALEVLVQFAWWIQRQEGDDPMRETRSIIERRFAGQPALVPPEYAQLARLFPSLFSLDQPWATKMKDLIFPTPSGEDAWKAAFGTFIPFVRPNAQYFQLLAAHYTFATAHPEMWSDEGHRRHDFLARLGQHAFLYYVWELYPLTGEGSLLAQFYQTTEPQIWASLMRYVGQSLKNSPKLEKGLVDRCIALLESRLAEGNPTELAQFSFWLDAHCLDLDWRLRSFIKTLKLGGPRERGATLIVGELGRLLEQNVDLVVEAFAELVGASPAPADLYLDQKEVEPILKAGLASSNDVTRHFALAAQESLLRAGLFEYLTATG